MGRPRPLKMRRAIGTTLMDAEYLTGRQLGNYRLERLLGQGGMSTVYYAVDVKLLRPAAVKVIDTRFQANPAFAERIVQEARAIAKWRHENIVDIYYADDQDGLFYFAMEYIDGLDLARVLKRYALAGTQVPQADVLHIGRAIAAALDYAHHKGVIHRDVKPSNVFIERSGRVVLGDFGVAMGLNDGPTDQVYGTARYIAPEQANRPSVAVPQSDLYALGVILYEMLTGQPPFDGPTPTSVALQHMNTPPPEPRRLNPAIGPAVEAVLLKALSKKPEDRYPSGAMLMDALEKAFLEDPPAEAQPENGQSFSPLPVYQVVADSTSEAPTQGIHLPEADLITPPAGRQPASSLSKLPANWTRLAAIGCAALLLVALVPLGGWIATNLLKPKSQAANPAPTGLPEVAATRTPGSQGIPPPTLAGSNPLPTSEETKAASLTGQRFVAYYNANSFYLLEVSGEQNPINNIAFERLDAQNVPVNTWNGTRWAQFYPVIRPGACVRIEILSTSPYLRPPQCQTYYSTRTPIATDPGIFWTWDPGSAQFRVLWRGQEVQRCQTGTSTCEFSVP